MLKIQKIRYCEGCRDLLPLKCLRCLKCPTRTPKPVEVFSWPPILETAACGCIKIACQREGCYKTFWRNVPARGKGGKATASQQYCSPQCVLIAARKVRSLARKQVPCDECGKMVYRKPCELKTFKRAFCSKACWFIGHAKEKYARKEQERRSQQNPTMQMLYCRNHAYPTAHAKVAGTVFFECMETYEKSGKECRARRTLSSKVNEVIMAAVG